MKKATRFLGCSILSVSLAMASVMPAFADETNQAVTKSAVSEKGVNMTLTEADKQLLKTIFDAKFYATKYPDVVKALGNDANKLFAHFITHGIWETREANADFDVNAYASAYEDLHKAFGSNVMAYYTHYYTLGKAEKRDCTTIDKALAKVGIVKSVSPLVNKDNTKQFDSIVARRVVEVSHHHSSSSSNGEAAPEDIDTDLYFDDVCKMLFEKYEKEIVDYCKQKGGIFEEKILPAWLDKKPELTGDGTYFMWLGSFWNNVKSLKTELEAEYGPDCMDDFKAEFEEIEEKLQTEFRDILIIVEDPTNATEYADLKPLLDWVEEYGNKKMRDFEDEYEKAHEEWQEKYDSQNFSYEGMSTASFCYKYFETQEQLEQWYAELPEPKPAPIENYRLAGYPTDDEMDDAIDAWLLENPEPNRDEYIDKHDEYVRAKNEAFMKDVLPRLRVYAREMILGSQSKQGKKK